MNVSIELTLLPLQDNFETPIKNFIKELRASKFQVLENAMSTQIYGEYDSLMLFLTQAIKTSFQKQENVLVNLKMVKSDRSNYEPNF
uniref:thiamine-binding protein n=1 Tax=Polaribacter sp. TaxID=1920175 RepID=UPI004047D00F